MWRKYHARLPGATESKLRRQENALLLQLAGDEATERAIRTSAPGRAVLHLATHGFFLERSCAGTITSMEDQEDEESMSLLPMDQQSPLLLSGLALAGANVRGKAPSGDNDGILTAEEIASLDLSGVEWAVLSACQTGLGEVRAGEGVFGLRRAFEVAGARTMIMTLWSVDDRASALWMESLFDRRLRGRRSTMDAVHEATLEVLKEQRDQGKHTHPYFWGPFVAVGDWK
jgi:CHAT domain-containing protein